MGLFKQRRRQSVEFDEILIDASNLPSFNTGRLEGRMELPLTDRSIYLVGAIFALIMLIFGVELFNLQVIQGAELRQRSEANKLDNHIIFAERGVIYDRNMELVAWNEIDYFSRHDFPVRAYFDRNGLGQTIGYVNYPKRDTSGFYFRTEYRGLSGIEAAYNKRLEGVNGEQLVEIDALNSVISKSAMKAPTAGDNLVLSIDAELTEIIHDLLASTTALAGFRSGAAAIMDVHTGEIIAIANFPSYDPELMSDGDDVAAIEALNNDPRSVFLNKVVGGLYTPGSIVKPFIAYTALKEKIINAEEMLVSNGKLVVENSHQPDKPSIFTDWRAHGAINMRQAIAFSSNIYFYIIAGGFENRVGLGIDKLSESMRRFGFGVTTNILLLGEEAGVVPDRVWKEAVFADAWRLGDTYITAIGQFGFQVTPLQVLRAYGALASGGKLFTPHVEKDKVGNFSNLGLDESELKIVQSGMRLSVTDERGTNQLFNREDVAIAAKSGTAELGASRKFVNTWIAGYWPYEKPRYSFVLLMEKGPYDNTVSAAQVMTKVFDWLAKNRPDLLKPKAP